MSDTYDQPDVGDGATVADEGVDTDALNQDLAADGGEEAPEPQYDDDGNEIEPVADDSEELEFEGVKAKVPKELAEKIKLGALRQADYTRKTQEVAERARLFDQEAQQRRANLDAQDELARTYVKELAAVTNLNTQISQFEALTPTDWEAIRQQDREEGTDKVGDLRWQYDQLRRQRDGQLTELQQKAAQREADKQRETATQISQARAALERDIPGWNTQKLTDLQSLAMEFGATPALMGQVIDPVAYKVLNELASLRAQLKNQNTAATAQKKVQAATAAAPVTQVGGKAPPTKARTTDSSGDRLSTEAWAAAERARLAQKNRRPNGQFKPS